VRLADFLSGRNRANATPAPTQPVTFKAIGRDAHGEEYLVDCKGLVAFVDENKRDQAIDAAEAVLRTKYPDGSAPDEKRRNEVAYQVLLRALRDADDPRVQLAASVDELRSALVMPEATRLYAEYVKFVDEEFPATPTPQQFDKLTAEAEKNS
jgi:hypothetical protein